MTDESASDIGCKTPPTLNSSCAEAPPAPRPSKLSKRLRSSSAAGHPLQGFRSYLGFRVKGSLAKAYKRFWGLGLMSVLRDHRNGCRVWGGYSGLGIRWDLGFRVIEVLRCVI